MKGWSFNNPNYHHNPLSFIIIPGLLHTPSLAPHRSSQQPPFYEITIAMTVKQRLYKELRY